jgi:hypothetical protein
MKEMADIRTDFLRQQRDLQRDFSRGQISEDLYKSKRKRLKQRLPNAWIFRRSITKNR